MSRVRRLGASAALLLGAVTTALATPGTRVMAQIAAKDATSDSAAVALMERSAAAYQSARTLRAEFVQTLTNARAGTSFRSSGEFFQQGAQHFAFRFTDPADDRIIADGAVLWLYLPSTVKGQVIKVPRAAGAGLDIASSVLRDPARRYAATLAGDTTIDGRTVRVINLQPRGNDTPFMRGTIWLDVQDALVRRAEFTDPSGMVRTLEFGRIRVGTILPADVFTFTPPPGVRVIDQAALLGGSVPPS
jgi:outer membrane lipoprotein carrier protein